MIVLLHGFADSPHTWDLVRPATRGRARSVVALAPAGGGDHTETPAMQERGVLLSEITTRPLEPDIVAYLTAGVRHCDAEPLIENARQHGWPLDAEWIGLERRRPRPAARTSRPRRLS